MNRIGCGLEVKFAEGAEAGTFTGYGAVFGNVDSHGDVIAKGAFRDTLRQAKASGVWPAMLLQHGGFGFGGDDMTPLGIWTEMDEDDKGLKVEGKLAVTTTRGRDLHELMKMTPRPAISGLSIGYRPVRDQVDYGDGIEKPRRTLKKVDLFEVSLVTMPSNTLARIDGVKGVPTERQFEQWLMRDAGFTAAEAKTIVSSGFKALKGKRDAAQGDQALGGLAELFNEATRRLRA